MYIYFLALFLIACAFLFDFIQVKWVRNTVLWCAAITFSLFAGLREVGVDRDSEAYHLLYSYMAYFPWKDIWKSQVIYAMEPGFVFLNKLSYSLGFSFPAFMLLIQIATAATLYPLIKRYSDYPMLSVIMYISYFYFFRDFTQIRYALACALLMSSLFALKEKKSIHWLLLQIAAGLIHNATWIGIFIVPMVRLIRNRYFYLVLPLIGYAIGKLQPVRLLVSFFQLPEQLTRYLSSDMDISASIVSSVFAFLVTILMVLFYDQLNEKIKGFPIFYAVLSIAACIGFMFLDFPIMQRVSGALLTSVIWIMPWLISLFTIRDSPVRHVALLMYFLVLSLFVLYGIRILNSGLLEPYS